MKKIDFSKENLLYVSDEQIDISSEEFKINGEIDYKKIRKKVEPWLTALFQSEHLSLLVGSGLSIALGDSSKTNMMNRFKFQNNEYKKIIKSKAKKEAKNLGRGEANFEDDLRVALKLLEGYEILGKSKEKEKNDLKKEINDNLLEFIKQILQNEKEFLEELQSPKNENNNDEESSKLLLLKKFLLSFGSRTATRERLHIFTTNYDRFIEFGLDDTGLLTIDRFIGKLNPVMRFHRVDLDYHYNPPGIRGEPRYVEGVVKYTKLHGSIDWKFEGDNVIKLLVPFGSDIDKFKGFFKDPLLETDTVVIFPNSSKAYETSFFPYSELFRDFSSAICRPNSVLVTYGYGFGDSHINRIISDMLTIPSTHLVIISYGDSSGRINKFIEQCNLSQLTIIIGKEFGDFEKLVNYYLPKPAIDRISERERRILEKRTIYNEDNNKIFVQSKKDDI